MLDWWDVNKIAWAVLLAHVYIILILVILVMLFGSVILRNMKLTGFEPMTEEFKYSGVYGYPKRVRAYNHNRRQFF